MNLTIHNAIIFAAQKHAKQVRKGTDILYITHPMEVMQILTAAQCAEDVIIAGILHDTLEDTETDAVDILNLFGHKVLGIVRAESEDKSKTWKERKQAAINRLADDSFEAKLVCCADKLSNIRSMYADKQTAGESLWNRFNAGKSEIKWYYQSIAEKLEMALSEYDMYKEFAELIDLVF
ncbi:MAG: HD domain-containing protein [Treponemataceae bacterium]|nr:MAG: HD domain-containing protein [Treponemataceae bacterium]